MRHGHGLRKLNRTSSHRLAMLQNMMNSLIEHEVIKTRVLEDAHGTYCWHQHSAAQAR